MLSGLSTKIFLCGFFFYFFCPDEDFSNSKREIREKKGRTDKKIQWGEGNKNVNFSLSV